jgi:hypothetical protein
MMRIKPNFDTWAIGLFVLEMITGRRMRYTREEMADLARKFVSFAFKLRSVFNYILAIYRLMGPRRHQHWKKRIRRQSSMDK